MFGEVEQGWAWVKGRRERTERKGQAEREGKEERMREND